MNKPMAAVVLIIAVSFIHAGLGLRSRMMDINKQKDGIVRENAALAREIDQKQRYRQSEPRAMADAFDLFINETRMIESYGGTRMDIVLAGTNENENIEDHYADTPFRGVKGLPLELRVAKFSNETDMASVLNDIYLLEHRTDFKVSEISTENNDLIVKGELYGT